MPNSQSLVRPATFTDRELISALLTSANLRHIHLDWVPALDLIDEPLFLVALDGDLPRACLAAPPDPNPIAWIRVFATAPAEPLEPLWEILSSDLCSRARKLGVEKLYSLALQPWFEPLLAGSGFSQANEVIFYEWDGSAGTLDYDQRLTIRRMRKSDLPGVERIDHSAFAPAWQHSLRTLSTASQLSTYATVCEMEGELVGYQISTASALGAHLARLAVVPESQRQGIGQGLVVNMLKHIARRGFDRVTVNTQADNLISQHLYRALGFEPTGQRYPMYSFALEPDD